MLYVVCGLGLAVLGFHLFAVPGAMLGLVVGVVAAALYGAATAK